MDYELGFGVEYRKKKRERKREPLSRHFWTFQFVGLCVDNARKVLIGIINTNSLNIRPTRIHRPCCFCEVYLLAWAVSNVRTRRVRDTVLNVSEFLFLFRVCTYSTSSVLKTIKVHTQSLLILSIICMYSIVNWSVCPSVLWPARYGLLSSGFHCGAPFSLLFDFEIFEIFFDFPGTYCVYNVFGCVLWHWRKLVTFLTRAKSRENSFSFSFQSLWRNAWNRNNRVRRRLGTRLNVTRACERSAVTVQGILTLWLGGGDGLVGAGIEEEKVSRQMGVERTAVFEVRESRRRTVSPQYHTETCPLRDVRSNVYR